MVPLGQDSFYHATRILDATGSRHASVFQFDPYIHAPEGNWVNWPWAYDGLLATIVVSAQWMGVQAEDLEVLAYAPLVWIPVNVGLCLLLANLLGFPFALRLALLIAFVCNPLVRSSQGVGMLDHHQAEQALFLATMCTWLAWQKRPRQNHLAFLAGFIPGFAPAIHTSLFLCLPPIALATLLCWNRNRLPPAANSLMFAAGIIVGITCATLPAAFPADRLFVHHTLSWFHIAAVCATAAGVVLLCSLKYSRGRLITLIAAALAATAVFASFLGEGFSYIAGTEKAVTQVTESSSYVARWLGGKLATREFLSLYTPWAMLLPLSLAGCALGLIRSRDPVTLGFFAFALFGLALLSGQFRFHVFGDVFLAAIPLFAASVYIGSKHRGLAWSAPALATLFTIPVIPTLLAAPPVALDEDYPVLLHVYQAADKLCRLDAGVIAANPNDGHYLRFHTDCPVVANNFLVDELARAKVAQSEEIMAAAAANQSLSSYDPWLQYLLVRVFFSDIRMAETQPGSAPRIELLRTRPTALDNLELVWESPMVVTLGGTDVPLARIFRVKHPPG